MLLPDGTTLMHGKQPYDPQKAHEYYLRTRDLKGRKRGIKTSIGGRIKKPEMFNVELEGKKVTLSAQELAKQRQLIDNKVQSIKLKLAKLNTLLKEKLRKAEEADRKRKESEKPDTASEKAEKARESKKYRDKHKQELKSKAKKAADTSSTEANSNEESEVDKLKNTIDAVRFNLKAAIKKQQALASATKN